MLGTGLVLGLVGSGQAVAVGGRLCPRVMTLSWRCCTSASQGFTVKHPALLWKCLLFAFLCVGVTGAHGSGLGRGPISSARLRAAAAACDGDRCSGGSGGREQGWPGRPSPGGRPGRDAPFPAGAVCPWEHSLMSREGRGRRRDADRWGCNVVLLLPLRNTLVVVLDSQL